MCGMLGKCSIISGLNNANCTDVESLPIVFSGVAWDWGQKSTLPSKDTNSQLSVHARTFPACGLMQAESRTHAFSLSSCSCCYEVKAKMQSAFHNLLMKHYFIFIIYSKKRILQVQQSDFGTGAYCADDALFSSKSFGLHQTKQMILTCCL